MRTISRFDKYPSDGAGGFRAKLKLAFAVATALDKERIFGVSIEAATGLLLIGGGGTLANIVGIVNIREPKAAGDVVDVMTHGELADQFFLNDGVTATVLGTLYYVDSTTGALTATTTTNKPVARRVADTPDKGRMIVRVVQG